MWLVRVFTVTCIAAVCEAQDAQNEPPVPSLQLLSGWLKVFPSEKVELSCYIDGSSDWKIVWHKDDKEQEENPDLSLSADRSVLNVTAAAQTSGSYFCKGQHKTSSVSTQPSTPLNIQVSPDKPKAILRQRPELDKMFSGESVAFTCSVDMGSGWEYQWYHDGKEVEALATYTIHSLNPFNSGQYYCKAKRGQSQFSAEQSKTATVQVSDPPTPSLKKLSPWLDVFETESVELSCEVSGSGWTFTWYKNQQRFRTEDEDDEDRRYFNITSVTQSDQGAYTCRAHLAARNVNSGFSNTSTIRVYENRPKPTLTKVPDFTPMYVGETVQFTCTVDVASDWSYQLWKDGSIRSDTKETFSFPLSLSDGGKYSCNATRGATTSTNQSVEIQQTVHDIPVPHCVNLTQFLDVFPTESVVLSCVMQRGSGWMFTWYRAGEEVKADDDVAFDSDGSTLSIRSASSKHAGRYSCSGRLPDRTVNSSSSSELTLTVYAKMPSVVLTQDPEYEVMFPGESVSFTCLVDMGSGWEYQWYHDGKEVEASAAYTIHSVNHSDSGQYYCKAKRGQSQFSAEQSKTATVQVSDPPTPSLKKLSPWLDVFETESVALSCKVSGSGWTFTWYKNQQRFRTEDEDDEDGQYFNITSVTQSDQGAYTCRAHLAARNVNSGFSNTSTIRVYENRPKPTLTKVPDFTPMYVGETVQFTCTVDVASDWSYQWWKDGSIHSATKETFSFPLSLSDGGKYSCKATRGATTSTNQSVEIQQTVHDIPVPRCVNLTQFLDVFPTESVVLSCVMQRGSGWMFTWYRAGEEVKADDDVSFNPDGSTLSIRSASLKHAGRYSCSGRLPDRTVNSSSSSELTLTVYAKMPSVVLTQDPEYEVMFPGESVSFSCHMNVSSGWEYIFHKSSQQLSPAGMKYSVNLTGASDRGSYTCRVKRGRDPVFSSDPSPAVVLDVKDKQPKPVMTQEPKADKVYVGESVTLDCQVPISSDWEYFWNKDGAALPHKTRTLKIHDANSSDSGNYECMAKRQKSAYATQHSDRRALQISEIPVPQLKHMTPWLDVFPSERAELRCGMEEGVSDWTYSWYKDGQKVHADVTVSFDSDATTLSISSAAAQHGGRYNCSGKLKNRPVNSIGSSGITLSVYATKPKVTLMQKPEYKVMHTGDSVSFSCHINVSSGWKYTWYKDGVLSSQSGNNYSISSVEMKNTGSYTCQGNRGVGAIFQSNPSPAAKLQIEERPQASIILLTGWSQVFATDSLELRCEVQASSDQWNFTWFREGESLDLSFSETYMVTPQNDPEQSLYTCRGVRSGRPSYSKSSVSYRTKNLLLKRRLLLSISGCLFFGLILVFGGCIVLRITRKPVVEYDKPEEENLFLTMAQLKDRTDAPNPLVEYITDEGIEALAKDVDENGTTPLIAEEVQAVTTESDKTEEKEVGLVSFKQ